MPKPPPAPAAPHPFRNGAMIEGVSTKAHERHARASFRIIVSVIPIVKEKRSCSQSGSSEHTSVPDS